MNHRFESDQVEQQALQPSDSAGLEARVRDAQPVSDKTGGITNVELDRINATDINSAADFEDPQKYAGMRREAEMLKQVEPALEQGADVENLHSWDQANQIGQYSPGNHMRGYADAYHSYHGSEAVAVEPQSDGSYNVLNGRHRIVAARDAGLKRIPAKIVG